MGNGNQRATAERATHLEGTQQTKTTYLSKQPLKNDDIANEGEYGALKESSAVGAPELENEESGRSKRRNVRRAVVSSPSYEDDCGSSEVDDHTEDGESDEDYEHDGPDVEEEVAESESDGNDEEEEEGEEDEDEDEDSAGSVIIVSDGEKCYTLEQ